jgi:hypothetical protein
MSYTLLRDDPVAAKAVKKGARSVIRLGPLPLDAFRLRARRVPARIRAAAEGASVQLGQTQVGGVEDDGGGRDAIGMLSDLDSKHRERPSGDAEVLVAEAVQAHREHRSPRHAGRKISSQSSSGSASGCSSIRERDAGVNPSSLAALSATSIALRWILTPRRDCG